MVMGEDPAAPVRCIYYTLPLPGLTLMLDTAPPPLLSGTWAYTVRLRGDAMAL